MIDYITKLLKSKDNNIILIVINKLIKYTYFILIIKKVNIN
jgi:hypothetical protein